MSKKIALIGSAPSSIRLAPYKDHTWALWACSPGAYAAIGQERAFVPGDAYFELHRWEPPVVGDPTRQVPWFSAEYVQFLSNFPGPVYTAEPIAEIRNSTRLPREKLLQKYGPYFFTSSLAWMAALALEDPELEELAFYGVDMAAKEEYAAQKPGCLFFVTEATKRGIKVMVPPESDLLQPQPLYGISEWSPMMVKLTARTRELNGRIAAAQQRERQAHDEVMFLQGAADNQQYIVDTWTSQSELDLLALRESLEAK